MTETYTYAGDGRRRQKVTASGTTNFIWDGQNVLAELDQSQVTQAQYTHSPGTWGGLVSQRRGGVSSFYGFDLADNTRALASSAAAITDSYSYKAFGPELSVSGTTTNPNRYCGSLGYYRDSATRQYVRARHLSVNVGRWMSGDPLGLAGGDLNPYRYAANSPLSFVDPSGAAVLPPVHPAVIVIGGIVFIGTTLYVIVRICKRNRRARCAIPPIGAFPPVWPIVGAWKKQGRWVPIAQRAYTEIMAKHLPYLSQTAEWMMSDPTLGEFHHVYPCLFVYFFDQILGPGVNDRLTIRVPWWAHRAFHSSFGRKYLVGPPPPPGARRPGGGWWNNRWFQFFTDNIGVPIDAACVLRFGEAMRAAVRIQDQPYMPAKSPCPERGAPLA